jgi:TetR/AcrR family transcriptional regulator, mexJK operon transcriptional repressor
LPYKEGNKIGGLFDQINKHPPQLKELLIEYFLKMQQKGQVKIIVEIESLAMSYLYMLYGEFISRRLVERHQITSIEEDFIKTSVLLYVSALKV